MGGYLGALATGVLAVLGAVIALRERGLRRRAGEPAETPEERES